jgi:pimeloyl-ACP methyl ester carboxylesterase
MLYSSGDARLFYQTLGSGPDVVLLHPTPVHHGFWLPIALSLSTGYRVTLPDLRGHGQSEAGQGVIDVVRLGEDIERLLDAAHIEAALFAGCSIGSYTLYELWRRIPGRVRGLAFCCGKPQPDTAVNRAKRLEDIEKIRLGEISAFFDRMARTLVGATSQARHPEKSLQLRAMMDATTAQALIAVQQGLAQRPDSIPSLPSITVPVLALAGAEDSGSTPEEMAVIHDLLPASDWHVLSDAGHYAPYEQPETVGRLLRAFFDRFGKSSEPG